MELQTVHQLTKASGFGFLEVNGAEVTIETEDIWDTYVRVCHYQQNIPPLKLIYSESSLCQKVSKQGV